jgi:GT2 family glycosyltransferase
MADVACDVHAFIVHWNAPEWCEESVSATLSSTGLAVMVSVVDNGGPDSRPLDLPMGVEVLETGANCGFTGGANVGLAANGTAPYVFIGCHDIRLEPEALRSLEVLLEQDDGLGIVGPVLDGAGGTEHDLDWISGAGMLMRRAVADTLRFDERFGSYVEDVDFCYRARDLGWRVGRAGGALARTRGSVDGDGALVLMHANTVAFFVMRRMWRSAAARGLLLVREAWKSARAGSWHTAALYVRAIGLAVRRIGTFGVGGRRRGPAPTALTHA